MSLETGSRKIIDLIFHATQLLVNTTDTQFKDSEVRAKQNDFLKLISNSNCYTNILVRRQSESGKVVKPLD